MAIGSITASGGLQSQLVSGGAGQVSAQAASGLGDAVNRLAQAGFGYLNSRTEIESVYDKRAQASTAIDLDTRFLEYQQERAAEFTEFSRGRSETPAGLTKDYDAMLTEKNAAFLATVPPRFREEVKAKLDQDQAMRVGSAFTSELSLLDTVDTRNLNTSLNTIGSGLKGGSVSLEDAQDQWIEMVSKTSLPEEDKASFILSGKATLQGLQFGTVLEQGAAGYGVANTDDSGSDVVAAGLLPPERAVLNSIAKNEAGAYNIWNGGSTFSGYSDHPAALGKAPGESTAAGRYQFILGTWRAASASYERATGVKVPNFSPEWQDRVALHWAEHQFNAHYSGATFKQILASGNPQEMLIIRDVLGKPRSSNPNDLEWKGLGGMGDAEFIAMMTGQSGIAGGGTGPAGAPNPWTDPAYSDMSLDSKMGFANAASAAAESQRNEQASRIKLERDSFLDQAYNAGFNQQPGVLEALQQSIYWDAAAQAKYNSGYEVYTKTEKSVSTIGASLAAGTPLTASDAKALGTWFGKDSLAGIISGDKAAYDKMRGTVSTAKIFPEGSADAFSAALGAPDTRQNALTFLASALGADATILKRSNFSNEVIADAQLFQNLARTSGDAETAYANFLKAKDVVQQSGKTPAQLTDESMKSFTKTFPDAETLVGNWNGWFSARPDTITNEATESQLMFDASTAYQLGYQTYGTAEGAEAYMQSVLGTMWGVSQTSKTRGSWGPGDIGSKTTEAVLMRFPPENFYPALNEDYGYLYKGVSDFAVANGATADGAVLVPDGITDEEVRSGKPPTYRVVGRGEFGEAITLPGRFGGEALAKEGSSAIASELTNENARATLDTYDKEIGTLEGQANYMSSDMKASFGVSDEVAAEMVTGFNAEREALVQKRDSAIIAAFEQGAVDPAVLLADRSVNDLAEEFSVTFTERFTTDPTLAKRYAQIMSKTKPEDFDKVLAPLVAKELKLPQALAELVVQKMVEKN